MGEVSRIECLKYDGVVKKMITDEVTFYEPGKDFVSSFHTFAFHEDHAETVLNHREGAAPLRVINKKEIGVQAVQKNGR